MAGNSNRISPTIEDKRAMLRRAFEAVQGTTGLLDSLKLQHSSAQSLVDDNINSSASNGHTASSNYPGSNSATDSEIVRAWGSIIEGFKTSREFLRNCAKYGLDAFCITATGRFPNPLPDKIIDPALRIVIDTNGNWERSSEREDIATDLIVGKIVGDEAIFVWLLEFSNLMDIQFGPTQSRGDYGCAIVGRSGGALA